MHCSGSSKWFFLGPWYYVGKHARKSLTTLSKEIFLANSEIIIVNEPPFGQLNIRPTVILQETKIFFNIFLARSFLFASDFESRYSAEIFFQLRQVMRRRVIIKVFYLWWKVKNVSFYVFNYLLSSRKNQRLNELLLTKDNCIFGCYL